MNNIELNIFTNYTDRAKDGNLIKNTFNSFINIFEKIPTNIWCHIDVKNTEHIEYFNSLKSITDDVYISNSLSHGYVTAIKNSQYDFMFMLEHDWLFLSGINNTLLEITEQMKESNLFHLRFNKKSTLVKGWDSTLTECSGKYFDYCITPALGNNPHIIDRKKFIELALPYIKIRKGSKGIEERLTFKSDLSGAIYGPLGYPKTIEHTDGRGAYINRHKL
jgi:hypothetical protein